MRIFKDLELVEQLGSGIPRILEYYGRDSFSFSDNFLRMTFTAQEIPNELSLNTHTHTHTYIKVVSQEGSQIGGQITEDVNRCIPDIDSLPHRQKEILKLIQADIRISRSGIAEVLHINESAI